MSKRPDKNLIVGLDIGTSKVVAIVGEVNDGGEIEIVGIGTHPSRGLKKGVWSTSSRPCIRSSARSRRLS